MSTNTFFLVQDGISCAHIEQEDGAVYAFAASELKRYVERLSGAALTGGLPVYIGSPAWVREKANVSYSLQNDGYAIDPREDCLILTGGQERGALYAVYGLLRELGCRWYFPGPEGESLPEVSKTLTAAHTSVRNPDMIRRCFTYDGKHDGTDEQLGEWVPEMVTAIDWFAKVGINAVYFCDPPYRGLPGLRPVAKACDQRGIMIEMGGHDLQKLVDRALFDTKPELFRELYGKRDPSGNLCTSNPEAIQMVCDRVSQFFRDFPWLRVSVLHLWCEDSDVGGGSWCSCEKCRSQTPAEQLLTLVNAIAARLKEEQPDVMVDTILYHDTLDMSGVHQRPARNIYGFFCPRERCRAHSIKREGCGKNERQIAALQHDIGYFGTDNMYVFEYYADFILFVNLGICLPSVIQQDVRDYRSFELNKMGALMFGRYSWWAYHTNMYTFARACWDSEYDREGDQEEFLRRFYGKYAESMREYYRLFEEASVKMLPFCDYADNLPDLRHIPPQCPEFHQKHIDSILEASRLYERCFAILDGLREQCREEPVFPAIDREWYLMKLTARDAKTVWYQMRGRLLGYFGDTHARAWYLDQAIQRREESARLMREVPRKYTGASGDWAVDFYRAQNEWNEKMKIEG